MEEFLKIVQEWPVIIQGALGSALFAFSVYAFQLIFRLIKHKISSFSNNSRISELYTERVKLGLIIYQGNKKAQLAAPLLYRMSRPMLRAFIWLVFGMILGETVRVLSLVGYFGSLYYLFSALDVVSPYEFEGDPKKRLDEIEQEIKLLKNKA